MRFCGTIPVFLIVCSVILSCNPGSKPESLSQDELFKRDHKTVLQEIQEMTKADQAIRNYLHYGTACAAEIDSIDRYLTEHNQDIDSFLNVANLAGLSAQQRDSLDKQMSLLQEKHTRRMIALIDKYGYPSSSRIDTSLHIEPMLLLEHGDWNYKDTVMKMLTTELAKKRLDSGDYELIRWNMDGRQGYPKVPGVWVLHKNPDGTVDTIQMGQ